MYAKRMGVLNGACAVLFFALSMPAQAGISGDMDGDGDVDLNDYALLRPCLLGPGQPVSAGCLPGRFDGDLDIDLRDAAGFQSGFTGPCPGARPNDSCQCPVAVGDGGRFFSTLGATTDGPSEPTLCNFFNDSQVGSDIWFCYTASCTGTAFVGLCGSEYDTKLAVYAGCGCPSASPLACSDDNCGRGVENVQSRVEISVTQGQQYMVRVGGFNNSQGSGRLTIGCNVNTCATGTGNCFTALPAPGCGDPACCAETCELDQFCCDVAWDQTCAGEAQGVCTGSFPACGPQAGSCGTPHLSPGCSNVDCCNTICFNDPFCCLTAWDGNCVAEAESACFLVCGPTAGDCFDPHIGPGCNDTTCCETVCSQDPFCCKADWDDICVEQAFDLCP